MKFRIVWVLAAGLLSYLSVSRAFGADGDTSPNSADAPKLRSFCLTQVSAATIQVSDDGIVESAFKNARLVSEHKLISIVFRDGNGNAVDLVLPCSQAPGIPLCAGLAKHYETTLSQGYSLLLLDAKFDPRYDALRVSRDHVKAVSGEECVWMAATAG